MVFALTFVAVVLLQVAAYAYIKSVRSAQKRNADRRNAVQLRAYKDGGRYIGATNRPGEN